MTRPEGVSTLARLMESEARPLVVITGAAGYLGSVVVDHLLRNGFRIRAVDNFMYHQTSLLPHFINPEFECLTGDVRDEDVMKRALEGADGVVHLAALVGAPLCEKREKEAWEINYEAALKINELRDPARQWYIFPNTTSGYGTRSPIEGLCTEDTPQEPISVYGRTKVEAEKELLKSDNVVTLRFTTVFGLSPRMRLDLMPNDFMWRALRQKSLIIFEGSFRRSFIYITDIARCVEHVIRNFQRMKNRAYNVGDESMNRTKSELAQMVARLTGCYVHETELRKDPDRRNYFISFERIKATGFRTTITLEQGLQALHRGLQTLHWTIPYANVEYY